MNSSGDEIDKFIIMSPETIKSGIVLYECKGKLQKAEDYLINLESIQFPDTDWIEGAEPIEKKASIRSEIPGAFFISYWAGKAFLLKSTKSMFP